MITGPVANPIRKLLSNSANRTTSSLNSLVKKTNIAMKKDEKNWTPAKKRLFINSMRRLNNDPGAPLTAKMTKTVTSVLGDSGLLKERFNSNRARAFFTLKILAEKAKPEEKREEPELGPIMAEKAEEKVELAEKAEMRARYREAGKDLDARRIRGKGNDLLSSSLGLKKMQGAKTSIKQHPNIQSDLNIIEDKGSLPEENIDLFEGEAIDTPID